jgi:hypothetical protein
MLQLNPTIAVRTPKGDAEALVIIDYGLDVNTVWLCRMRGGKVLHFYSDDILIYDNPMNGNGWDIKDEFPQRKIKDEDLPSGGDDIELDFSKKQVRENICICNRCKKEGKNGFMPNGLLAFFPIVYRLKNGEIPHNGLEYVAGGYYCGYLCKDCFFAKL